MRRRTTTESSLPITKGPYRSIVACAALLLGAGPARAATPATIDHVRGIILGTTVTSLDVGTPKRDDIHLEMAPEPYVVIAEPGDASALDTNVFVSVVSDAKKDRVRCVVIVPDTAHVFASGRTAWDAPGAPSMLTSGRISAIDRAGGRTVMTVGYRGTSRRFALPKSAAIITLRPGSREALLSPHNVFVFATPPTTELTDSVRSIIVADGTLALPF
jgi:hypothetical protein